MDEQERRVEAVTRFLRGEPAAALCRALGRSRRWPYKWLRRYEPGDPGWARSRSRAPHRIPHKTPEAVVRLVCAIRKRLLHPLCAKRRGGHPVAAPAARDAPPAPDLDHQPHPQAPWPGGHAPVYPPVSSRMQKSPVMGTEHSPPPPPQGGTGTC